MARLLHASGFALALLIVQQAAAARWTADTLCMVQTASAGPEVRRDERQKSVSTVLDRVVAVVGGTAILASDVDDEMRFAAFQPEVEPAADNTPQRALDRLIDRALINNQRVLQPGLADVPQAEVDQAILELRKTIPACRTFHCSQDAGWLAFLQAHAFTLQQVENRIRERLEILKFMETRFGAAVRISREDVEQYYDHVLVPQLRRNHVAVPTMSSVAPQILAVLRQQRINTMVDEWLRGLRSDTEVHILDTAYGVGKAQGSAEAGPFASPAPTGKGGAQ
ncbi:MAG TPA: peptidylprolyl isomerase [Acidobacteriaceae bacterium]|nr:peptidylprolyl isomerase [Acidobacteriaceae bacterium]